MAFLIIIIKTWQSANQQSAKWQIVAMLSVIYAVCYLSWVSHISYLCCVTFKLFMLSITISFLCWVSHISSLYWVSNISSLCWVSHISWKVLYAGCHCAECGYAERHFAEYGGAIFGLPGMYTWDTEIATFC
jgi:hypothetical protein